MPEAAPTPSLGTCSLDSVKAHPVKTGPPNCSPRDILNTCVIAASAYTPRPLPPPPSPSAPAASGPGIVLSPLHLEASLWASRELEDSFGGQVAESFLPQDWARRRPTGLLGCWNPGVEKLSEDKAGPSRCRGSIGLGGTLPLPLLLTTRTSRNLFGKKKT